jgi:hypothetical protein
MRKKEKWQGGNKLGGSKKSGKEEINYEEERKMARKK